MLAVNVDINVIPGATLAELLAAGAGDATAIAAPGRRALSYAALRALVTATIAACNAMGIGRNDRIAIVLANGPEMATAFLAFASGTTSRPKIVPLLQRNVRVNAMNIVATLALSAADRGLNIMQATEKAIREFAAQRLADFKVPRQIVFLDEIPTGATGKLQRIGLAQKLGLA